MKNRVRLTESDLHRIVKESVNRVLGEDTKAQRKKDPMNQWFKDMDDAQKHRDNMEYITKGGRKPKHWKQRTDDTVDEAYKPLGAKYSDEHISKVTNAFHRQIANLLTFMNAYSDTILSNNILDEDSYDRLFNQLAEIDSYAH